jgi:hypothetical protein
VSVAVVVSVADTDHEGAPLLVEEYLEAKAAKTYLVRLKSAIELGSSHSPMVNFNFDRRSVPHGRSPLELCRKDYGHPVARHNSKYVELGTCYCQRTRVAERNRRGAKKTKRKVVPGIEPRLPESESDVLTITLYNRFCQRDPALDATVHVLDYWHSHTTSSVCRPHCPASSSPHSCRRAAYCNLRCFHGGLCLLLLNLVSLPLKSFGSESLRSSCSGLSRRISLPVHGFSLASHFPFGGWLFLRHLALRGPKIATTTASLLRVPASPPIPITPLLSSQKPLISTIKFTQPLLHALHTLPRLY